MMFEPSKSPQIACAMHAAARPARAASLLLLSVGVLAACQPIEVAPFRTDLPATTEVATYSGQGILIDHPRGATIDTLPPPDGARFALRIRGPAMTVGLPDGGGTWSGPAYELELHRFENQRALGAESWVVERVLGAPGAAARDTTHVRIGGRAGVRVVEAGVDAWIVSVYLARDRQMLALRYLEYPVGGNPAAPALDAVHSMMLSSFRYVEQ